MMTCAHSARSLTARGIWFIMKSWGGKTRGRQGKGMFSIGVYSADGRRLAFTTGEKQANLLYEGVYQEGDEIRFESETAYARVRVDGSIYDLTETIPLDKNRKHNIEIVVDRVVIRPDQNRRLTDAVEIASALSGGLVLADIPEEKREILFSQNYACDDCGISIEELTPRMFSFNSPYGACPTCGGLGTRLRIDPALIIPDPSKSILDGGITASGWNGVKDESISRMYYDALAEKYHFDLATPIGDLPEHVREILLYGTGDEELTLHYDTNRGAGVLRRPFEGIVCNLERRYQETQSDAMRASLEDCMAETACPDCHGARLRPEVLAVTVGGRNISEFTALPITEELAFLDSLELSEKDAKIADSILREVRSRLHFLQSVVGGGAGLHADLGAGEIVRAFDFLCTGAAACGGGECHYAGEYGSKDFLHFHFVAMCKLSMVILSGPVSRRSCVRTSRPWRPASAATSRSACPPP